jgi:hypothetical protein
VLFEPLVLDMMNSFRDREGLAGSIELPAFLFYSVFRVRGTESVVQWCGERSRRELMTDFPVQSKGIREAAETPAVLLPDGKYLGRPSGDGLGENRIGIGNGEDHSDGTAADGIGTCGGVICGLVAQPELRAVYGKPDDSASAAVFQAIDFFGSERGLVEINRFRAVHGEPRSD